MENYGGKGAQEKDVSLDFRQTVGFLVFHGTSRAPRQKLFSLAPLLLGSSC